MPSLSSKLAFFGIAAVASAGQVHGSFRSAAPAEPQGSLVQSLDFKHRLRVCNAYPYSKALDVYRGEEDLTGAAPMAYKSCRDFKEPLKVGDKLDFKVEDTSAGTFSVSDLPNNDATLLLVIHRHDTLSTAVSFDSHVFANLQNSQVAVIDTYKGKISATPYLKEVVKDKTKAKKASRREELRYSSVVGVNEGQYAVELDDADGKAVSSSSFVALDNEVYVVMRTGVESQQGESFPEELVVFPQSDPAALPHESGASAKSFAALLLSAAVFLGAAAA